MRFLDRSDEMRRLDSALRRPGAFAVIWGRRRVGKSRLLIEWSRRHGGLYTVADQSAPTVQRRYLAAAVAERFPGFADVEYPDWQSLLTRLAAEADRTGWRGPFVMDELPHLIVADPAIAGVLQNWLDRPERRLCVVVSRIEPAHDARGDTGCRRSALRPGERGVRGAPLEAGVPERGLRRGRGARSRLHVRALGRNAPLLGACGAFRARSRGGGGRPGARPRRAVARRAGPAAARRDPAGDGVAATAGHDRCRGPPGERDCRPARPARLEPVEAACIAHRDAARTTGDLRSAPARGRASAACIESTIRSCGCGFASSHRTGPPWPRRRARRGCTTGAGTGRAWKRRPGRSCAAWRCRCCIAPMFLSRGSAPSSRPGATGAVVTRSSMSLRSRWMVGGCSWERRSGG